MSYQKSKLLKEVTKCHDYVQAFWPLFYTQYISVSFYQCCEGFDGKIRYYKTTNDYLDEVRFCIDNWKTNGDLDNSMSTDEMVSFFMESIND